VPIAHDDAQRGSRLAYVTIVVFSDFQCPFCSKLETTFEQLRREYGDDLRIVFKHEPLTFHPHARLAAEAGHGVLTLAGAEAFWRYHDTAFRRQDVISPEAIRAWAVDAGVDPRALEEGLESKRWSRKIDDDIDLARRLGAVGTPSSFVNGTAVPGAVPHEKWKELVDAELERAKSLHERGVARDRIYTRLAATNFKPEKEDEDDPPAADKTIFKVPVAGSPARGPSTALVTIVEFSDFQCPYCKRVEPTLERVRATYGDRVRIVWKDQPLSFHPRAMPAAHLAREALAQKGETGFWSVHDKLFDAQPKLDDADLEAVAKKAGLDVASAMAAVKAKKHQKAIDADVELADDMQAAGTPHFFVNGRRLTGAQPFEKFQRLIDEEMVRAEGLVRSGIARSAVYDAAIKDGQGPTEPERKTVAAAAAGAPFRGTANAKVVIQQFSDFQCPFCGRVEPTLEQVLKDYPGKVKIVWRDLPLAFHANAPLAAEAAREAFAQKGNEGFFKMHKLLFDNQQNLERQDLEGYAKKIGLDVGRFGRALDSHVHKAAVDADQKAATDAAVSGTPAFFVGPFFLSGAQPYPKFKKLVERTLAEPPPGQLVVRDVVVGTGATLKSGDKAEVHYVGTLTNGVEFDSSRTRGQPFTFTFGGGQVIKGWEQGLVGMKVGGKRKLTVPPDLAYGDRGVGTKIPPKSTLVFEVELLSIAPP
jgi:protein-disulfide isomerase